ncbi:MAG: PmoA family protein [Candidatus Latescibacteria bacterium]|nr:PmoA family protein [Candidatus Latescibacterota bacterium]
MGSTAGWEVRTDSSNVRLKFFYQDRFVLAYNTGGPMGDFFRPRPDFYPVYSPAGCLLTDQHTYRHVHHASIWLGHGRVGHPVNNFYHDTPRDGLITTKRIAHQIDGPSLILGSELDWVNIRGGVDLKELRLVEVIPAPGLYVLDWYTRIAPPERPITMLRDNHSFLCFRVADTIDVEDGGQIINTNGQRNEEECMRQPADWIDYSGTVTGHPCGLTLMNHPANPPSNWFVRNYGTVCLSPFLDRDVVLDPGQPLEFRARFLLHDGGPDDIDIPGHWQAFTHRPEWQNPLPEQ